MAITQQQMLSGQALRPGAIGGSLQRPVYQTMAQQPQYGLAGSESALTSALGGSSQALQQGQGQALNTLVLGNQLSQQQLQQGRQALAGGNFGASAQQVDQMTGQPLFQQAAQGVGAYNPAGLQAQGVLAALSGAQGQQAFDQAFTQSPVQKFLQEQGQRAVLNAATATGGLGGGEVQRELTRYGQGLAGTQLQQQIQNLAALSGQGLQAAGQQGQFLSQAGQQQGNLAAQNASLGTQASIASASNRLNAANNIANLFGQGAGLTANLAGQGAGYQMNTGQNIANLISGTGGALSSGRLQAGRDIASQIGQSTSALANLVNQQGSGLSDIAGQTGANISNLLAQAGTGDAQSQMALAQLLANISTGQGSQLSNIYQNSGNTQANLRLQQGGNIQNLIGNLAGAYGYSQGAGAQ